MAHYTGNVVEILDAIVHNRGIFHGTICNIPKTAEPYR